MATADFTVIGLGRSEASASSYLAEIRRRLEGQDRVGFRMHAMGTSLEGEVADILALVGETWSLPNIKEELQQGSEDITVRIEESGDEFSVTHDLAPTERDMLVLGGLLNFLKEKGERVGGNGASPNGSDG